MRDILETLHQLQSCHQRLARQSEKQDWDAVLIEWKNAEELFFKLQKHSLTRLTKAHQIEARVLIEELLATERIIMARIGPWMEQVKPMLEAFSRTSMLERPKDGLMSRPEPPSDSHG